MHRHHTLLIALVATLAATSGCPADDDRDEVRQSGNDAVATGAPNASDAGDVGDASDVGTADAAGPSSTDARASDGTADAGDAQAPDVDGVDGADAAGDDTLETQQPLADAAGLGLWLEAVHLDSTASGSGPFLLEAGSGVGTWAIANPASGEPLYSAPPPDAQEARTHATGGRWTLSPGQVVTLDAPALLAWAPTSTSLSVTLRAHFEATEALETTLTIESGVGLAQRAITLGRGLGVTLRAEAGVGGLDADSTLGMTRQSSRYGGDAAAHWDSFVQGLGDTPLHVKLYDGTRRYLLKPGCESDAACAEGGESYPCVEKCACRCGPVDCDCDFSAVEADMRARVAGLISATAPPDAADPADTLRIHYVYKRSLGGSGGCDENGEVDVDAATYGAFYAEAVRAAHRINRDYGAPVIAGLSPQNESNHPLQDGPHENSAGQPYVGGEGIADYVDLIVRASCTDAGRCCQADRYVASQPDSIGQLAHALVAARAYRDTLSEDDEPDLLPPTGMIVYLDVEQVDPIIVNDDGPPSVVTPADPFFTKLKLALAQAAGDDARSTWASELLFVDTYPGSWAPPWFEDEGRILHHVDPTTGWVLRGDPVRSADLALTRGSEAVDAFVEVFGGPRPSWVLGEVGWSSFDGDELGQAAFMRRIFEASAALQRDQPQYRGFLWFKDADRKVWSYPSWDSAPNPLGDGEVACDAPLVGPVACTAQVFLHMGDYWGFFQVDAAGGLAPKPSWFAFIEGFEAWAK